MSDSSSNELDYEGRGLKRSLETEPVSDSSSNELDYEGMLLLVIQAGLFLGSSRRVVGVLSSS